MEQLKKQLSREKDKISNVMNLLQEQMKILTDGGSSKQQTEWKLKLLVNSSVRMRKTIDTGDTKRRIENLKSETLRRNRHHLGNS